MAGKGAAASVGAGEPLGAPFPLTFEQARDLSISMGFAVRQQTAHLGAFQKWVLGRCFELAAQGMHREEIVRRSPDPEPPDSEPPGKRRRTE